MVTETSFVRLRVKLRKIKPGKTRIAAVALAMLANPCSLSAAAENGNGPVLKGKAAIGGWQQDKPGVRRLLNAQDLRKPATFLTEIAATCGISPNAADSPLVAVCVRSQAQ
jgi:hypothetical protein